MLPRYNTAVGRHLLGPPYGRGTLWDFTGSFIRYQHGLKLDTQTVPSAQNTDDNGSKKTWQKANTILYRTLSLADCASSPELSITAAHSLASCSGRAIFSWYTNCDRCSRGYLILLKPDCMDYSGNWIELCVKGELKLSLAHLSTCY